MFETTVVESKKHKVGIQRYLTLPVSIGLHVVIIVAVVVGAIWNVSFPTNSPAQVAQYSMAAAPPPPPPKAAPVQTQVKPVEVPKNIQEMAPTQVPEKVQPVAAQPSASAGVTGGVEGGVEGGVVGGVVGGTVGGVITDTAPPPPKEQAPLRVGGDVKAPVTISRVEPQYPEVARKARISGIVIVECIIDKSGSVRDVQVLKGLPFGLDQAAVEAVKKWKFKPGTLNGQPVDVIFNLTVNFKLN